MLKILQSFVGGLSYRERILFYVAVGVIVFSFFYWVMFNPFIKEAKRIEERISIQKNMIRTILKFISRKDIILQDNQLYSDFFLRGVHKEEELIADFLKKIERIGKSNNIAFTNIHPVEKEEYEGYFQYSLTFECEGKLEDLIKFFYSIESLKSAIRIVSFQIAPKNRSENTVKCTGEVVKIIVLGDDGEIIKGKSGKEENVEE